MHKSLKLCKVLLGVRNRRYREISARIVDEFTYCTLVAKVPEATTTPTNIVRELLAYRSRIVTWVQHQG